MSKSSSLVLLILGAGPNVGQSVAKAFAAKGYKIALVSRSLKEGESTQDQLNISADLSDPDSIIQIFSKVKESLGLPSVVVYNGENRALCLEYSLLIFSKQAQQPRMMKRIPSPSPSKTSPATSP
jgi:NAD(P)-dependent dehydrogenase (short-subunit alcohol dehydrogenase family)